MFFLLIKTTLYILNGLPPFFSALLHAVILALYLLSVKWQAGSDYLLPSQPSKIPWYIRRGCGPPVNPDLKSACQQAQASFAVAICMWYVLKLAPWQCITADLPSVLFATYLGYSIYQAIPTAEQKAEIREIKDTEAAEPSIMYSDDEKWEYDLDKKGEPSDSPAIPMTPMTPRTQAFNTLSGTAPHTRNRDLPLRHHIAMGDEVYQSNKGMAS